MRRAAIWLAIFALVVGVSAIPGSLGSHPAVSPDFVHFESSHVHPAAMTPDGTKLLVVNTPDNRLSVFDLTGATPARIAEIPVGLEPVSVAARSNTCKCSGRRDRGQDTDQVETCSIRFGHPKPGERRVASSGFGDLCDVAIRTRGCTSDNLPQMIMLDKSHHRLRIARRPWSNEKGNAACDVRLMHRELPSTETPICY